MNKDEMIKALNDIVDTTIEVCKSDMTTKDGYGTLMSIVGRFEKWTPVAKKNFILFCIVKGYPKESGMSVIRILGL